MGYNYGLAIASIGAGAKVLQSLRKSGFRILRLLFRSCPASGAAVRSHKGARASAARKTPGTVPAQTLNRSAAPGGAIGADRPGAQLARNPAAGDDKPLGAAAARRADGNGNPSAIEIAAATAATAAFARCTARLISLGLGASRRLRRLNGTGAWREPDSDFSSLPMLPPALPDCASVAVVGSAAETSSATTAILIVC